MGDGMHKELGKLVVWRRFSGVATYFRNAIDDNLREHANLSLSEVQLMIQIRSAGESVRMIDLAKALRISKAGITKMVGRLEEQGLVRRKASSTDGRVRNVILTPRGAKQLKGTRPLISKWLNQNFTDVFNDQELKTLNKLMLKLIEANEFGDPADH
jgi:DNA-binding MarR family transcriptional regulator